MKREFKFEVQLYQLSCLSVPDNDSRVQQTIAARTIAAHAQMQDCLDEVLALEGWDRQTLKMPEGLRCRQKKAIQGD
jgi:hypothetical protein